jgi:hypothetical protein
MSVKSYDDLFRVDAEHGTTHPRILRWRELHAQGYSFSLTIHRKWNGLAFSPPKLFVTLRKHEADPGILEEMLWEDELNQGLVDLGVRASDPANEALRYALAFRSAFDAVALRHDQDYLRSVLIELLRDEVFATHPAVKDTLDQIRTYQPHRGRGYDQALASVEAILRAKAHELETRLRYERDIAVAILAHALAQYLSEIFHLAARRAALGR